LTIERPDRFRLRLDDGEVPSVVLALDKAKTLKLFGEEGAKQVTILDVDTTPLLANALAQIQDACGTGWRANAANPNHNCALTPLGQSFGPNWRTSAAFALVRLLTMTPANANVTGTSLEDFKKLIDGNPGTFAFTFADVLAETLKIGRTDPFVPTAQLIRTLQRQLFAGHPAVSDSTGARLSVSLYDALNDLTPLAARLGPVGQAPWAGPGEHPGVLVPDPADGSFVTKSNVMLPEFQMRVVADSGLRRVEGVRLGKGGGDMYVREGGSPLRFDFNDPSKLQLSGLAPAATIDMRFAMREFGTEVPSCTKVPECKTSLPPPLGTPAAGSVWTLPPFLLEPIVTGAALLTYEGRTFNKCYFNFDGCKVGVAIGQNGDPPGWSVFTNDLRFGGDPPPPPLKVPQPQFLWELLTEVAQVSVHDPDGNGAPDVAEGAAEPVYALRGVGIGLTAEQIVAELRPTLQRQADAIADIILGRYWLNNDALDFYYRREAPGAAPYLYFVAEDDLRPDDEGSAGPRPYGYTRPGFFREPDLGEASRVSAKAVAGVADAAHEKYQLPRGASTLYMQGDGGAVYRVDFYVPEAGDPVEISAEVKRL
jgi:hypothetical protein